MTKWIHCCMNHNLSHVNFYHTYCVLRLFKRPKIQYISLWCRFTNTGLFALSTCTVHWSMSLIMFWGKDQSTNRVALPLPVLSLGGQPQLSMIMSVVKQRICLPTRKAINTPVKIKWIVDLVHRKENISKYKESNLKQNWKCFTYGHNKMSTDRTQHLLLCIDHYLTNSFFESFQ